VELLDVRRDLLGLDQPRGHRRVGDVLERQRAEQLDVSVEVGGLLDVDADPAQPGLGEQHREAAADPGVAAGVRADARVDAPEHVVRRAPRVA
jgi:hypothetical protein